MIEAVLFDLDGTLIDTAPDFHSALQKMRSEDSLPPLAYEDVRQTVSDGARALIKLAYHLDINDPVFEVKHQRLLELYLQDIAVNSCLFPQLGNMILWLHENKIPMAIVTNKPRLYSEALLSQLRLFDKPIGGYFQNLTCPDDVQNTKPDPEPLFKACKDMNVLAERSIYVGDHRRDIEAGRAANMRTIAARFGYIHAEDEIESWQADIIAESGEHLHDLLKDAVIGKNLPQG